MICYFSCFLFYFSMEFVINGLKESGSFLGKDGDESEKSGKKDNSLYLFKGNKKEYCDKFNVNYEYYCKGTIENVEIFTKFCPSFKKACIQEGPQNPFTPSKGTSTPASDAEKGGGDSDFPDIDNPTVSNKKKGRRQKVKKMRPCTPDCDQRIHPHCTVSCKCDYSYPYVQKFCNPPPLPLFLNTCRLWYNGCPKYEQYHYSSQFVYSKAEKGKVLEGPKTSTTFQLLTPSGQTLPYKAPSRIRRNSGLVFWPHQLSGILPPSNETKQIEWSDNEKLEKPAEIPGIEDNNIEQDSNTNVTEVNWIGNNKTNSEIHLEPAPPLPKDYKRKDQVITNKIHLEPAPPLPKDYKAKDQVITDKDKKEVPNLPRTKKTTGGQSVPVYSDSVFSNALSDYNSFTDSRGILHRPRSRSPFTKPGLWEPNPDDPHNRDHANKFWYNPYSVGVDWLQGQLAWGGHWAVPAAGTGGTAGFSAIHFPSIGTFLNIPDDYD